MLAATASASTEDGSKRISFLGFYENFMKLVMPAAVTMFCGTFTYPVAVRIARKVFRLRGFYAIHISIAPFLALLHVNIFGTLQTLGNARFTEQEYERMAPLLAQNNDANNDTNFVQLRRLISRARDSQSSPSNAHCSRLSAEAQTLQNNSKTRWS